MSKPLDLNKSVYELTREYPELVDILKKIGFTEITNPAMMNSMGRMMTIPKGAKMKKISMMKVVATLIRHGYDLVGERPNISFTKDSDEEDTNAGMNASVGKEETAENGEKPTNTEGTTEALKGYLRRLGQGEDLEAVRADFVKNFSEVDASEIMTAEQELMKEGTPLEEVQKLCDVHSALFHGATREEKIANAEKAVASSMKKSSVSSEAVKDAIRKVKTSTQKEAEAVEHRRRVKEEKQQRTAELKAIEGHPLSVFSQENTKLEELLKQIRSGMDRNELSEIPMEELRHLAVHYAKKGDLLYPLLKVRHQITGPSDVMWTVDDEIRHEITALSKSLERDEAWKERLQAVITRAEEMIYKEENILFPICAMNLDENEWIGIYHDAKDYHPVFGIQQMWSHAEAVREQENKANSQALLNGEIVMPGGHMTVEQLTALLNTVPIEITFIDDQNINRFFNEGPKVFKRPQMALDREVFSCHPPKIEPMVRSILDSFRDGTRDTVPVWMEKEGKPFLVQYMAVRDRRGKYLGTVEVVQDMSFAQEHFAGK